MKSLLVDVLRQAQGDAPAEDDAPATRQEPRERQEPSERHEDVVAPPPVADELNLMETGQFEAQVDDPAPAETHPLDNAVDVEDDAPDSDTPERPARLAATSILSARGARLSERPPLATRIARLSPVICVLAVSGVASGYLLFNSMAGGSLNDDLDEISEIVSERSRGNWLDEPVAETDVFDRAPAKTREPVVRNEESFERQPGTDEPAAAIAETARRPSTPEQNIAVSVSPARESAINDPAFQHVSDAYDDYRAGRYADAEQHYKEALRIEPNHRSALLGLASAYLQTSRRTEAISAYERVLDIEPGNTVAASAILSIRSSEPGWDSESELKHLIQRFPYADHLHYSLGSVFVGEKRWSEARRAFEAARALVPLNPAYNYNLAVSCEQLGDIRCARTHYQSALNNADGFASLDRTAVERHLDRLSATLQDPL